MFHRRRWSHDVVTSIKCVSVLQNQKLSFLLLYSELSQAQGTDFIKTKLKLVIANLFTMRNLTSGQLEGLCQPLSVNFSFWQGFQKVALAVDGQALFEAALKPWCVISRLQGHGAEFLLFSLSPL